MLPHGPEISIVMPSRNDQAHIENTVASVLGQSFGDFELISIDDGSTDNTVEIVRNFNDRRIVFLSTNGAEGAACARNIGTRHSKGQYIAFIDSDDLWHVDKLKIQIQQMNEHKQKFTYTRYDIIDEHGDEIAKPARIPSRVDYKSLLPFCFIRTSSVVYHPERCGGRTYFPDMQRRQDFAMFLALLKKIEEANIVDHKLCSYRLRQHSLSSNKMKNIPYNWKLYRDVEGLPLLSCMKLMISWMSHASIETARRRLGLLF